MRKLLSLEGCAPPITEWLATWNARRDVYAIEHVRTMALDLLSLTVVPEDPPDEVAEQIADDLIREAAAAYALRIQIARVALAIDGFDVTHEPLEGLDLTIKELRRRALRYARRVLEDGGPLEGFDEEFQATLAIRYTIWNRAFELASIEWFRSDDGRDAIARIAERTDLDELRHEVESTAEGWLRRHFGPTPPDVISFCTSIVEHCHRGHLQMEEFASFLRSPVGLRTITRVAARGGIPDDAKDDIAQETFLEARAWRICLGGIFDPLNLPAIVTTAARRAVDARWSGKGVREVLTLDAGRDDDPYLEAVGEDESPELWYLARFAHEDFKRGIETSLQTMLAAGRITERLREAVLLFVDWFAQGGPREPEVGAGGQTEVGRATYFALRKLEAPAPLERDGDGRYTDRVRARKAYLQRRVLKVLREILGD